VSRTEYDELYTSHKQCLLLLFIDYAEAAKHTDIQKMIKAVNIKDNTKITLKNLDNRCTYHTSQPCTMSRVNQINLR